MKIESHESDIKREMTPEAMERMLIYALTHCDTPLNGGYGVEFEHSAPGISYAGEQPPVVKPNPEPQPRLI